MKKQFILLLLSICFVAVSNAQSVKKQTKDTGNAYRANDRLRPAGPKSGWKKETKTEGSAKKISKPTDSVRRSKSGNR